MAILAISGESWAGTLRRRAAMARGNNPIELPFLIGSVRWTRSTAYALAQVVSLGGNVYRCTVPGTSAASGGPTGFGSAIVDNTVTWAYIGARTAPAVLANQSVHDGTLTNIKAGTDSMVDNTGVFRFRGGVPTVRPANPTFVSMVAANLAPNTGNWAGSLSAVHSSATVLFEGLKLEIALFALTQNIAISVDGRYIDSLILNGTGGTTRYHVLDFTNVVSTNGPAGVVGRSRHVITVEWSTQIGLLQMATEATGTISYPPVDDNFSVAYVGDSQIAGSGELGFSQTRNCTLQLSYLLGLPDMSACGIGGTGFVNPGASTKFIGHAIDDMIKLNTFRRLKYAFVQSSANDPLDAQGLIDLYTNIVAFYRLFRQTFPDVPLFIIGIVTGGSAPPANVLTRENTVLTAVADLRAAGDDLIFAIRASTDPAGAWITGTGNIGAPDGTGSADFNISTDTGHMSASGHAFWARKVAAGVLRVCATTA